MPDTLEQTDVQGHEHEHLQGKVTFQEPDAELVRGAYEQKLGEYVAVRGQAPRVRHDASGRPCGAWLGNGGADPLADEGRPFLVTSPDYDRDTITLYF